MIVFVCSGGKGKEGVVVIQLYFCDMLSENECWDVVMLSIGDIKKVWDFFGRWEVVQVTICRKEYLTNLWRIFCFPFVFEDDGF